MGFPAAAGSTNVGGQGAHWTCAIPRPSGSERVDFIADAEWEDLVEHAERLLHAQSAAFADSPIGAGIRSLIAEELSDFPDSVQPSTLPIAGDPQPDGSMRWTGTDTVLGPLLDPASPLSARFELRDLTLVRAVRHEGGRATGVAIQDLRTGESSEFAADAVVVAADAIRSPQLLFASGIRPPALGRYLTEHPVVISTIAVDGAKIGRFASEEDLERELQRRAANPPTRWPRSTASRTRRTCTRSPSR